MSVGHVWPELRVGARVRSPCAAPPPL